MNEVIDWVVPQQLVPLVGLPPGVTCYLIGDTYSASVITSEGIQHLKPGDRVRRVPATGEISVMRKDSGVTSE